MKIYISGPMRGYDDLNIPAFLEAEKFLLERGHETCNPAVENELCKELNEKEAEVKIRAWMATDCLKICLWAEGIAMLPNWQDSTGARAELALALSFPLPAYFIRYKLNAKEEKELTLYTPSGAELILPPFTAP